MASVKSLLELGHDNLVEFAKSKKVDPSKFDTDEALAQGVSGIVTPEDVEAFKTDKDFESLDDGKDGDNAEAAAARKEQEAADKKVAEEKAAREAEEKAAADAKAKEEAARREAEEDGLEDDDPNAPDEETDEDLEARRQAELDAVAAASDPTPQSEPGMGYKRVKAKTVSIFSNKPHETVKNVAGVMVPLTLEEYESKTDAEIIEQLRKLKKI